MIATPICWTIREVPLEPRAVAARGPAARRLAERLLAESDEDLGALSGVASSGLLVAMGEAERLPWADGVVYLGTDPVAAALYLPTVWEPDVHPALLYQAFRRKLAASPLAVLLEPDLLISLQAARAISRDALRAWLHREAA